MVRERDDRVARPSEGAQCTQWEPGLLLPLGEGLKLVHKANPTTCKSSSRAPGTEMKFKDPVINTGTNACVVSTLCYRVTKPHDEEHAEFSYDRQTSWPG